MQDEVTYLYNCNCTYDINLFDMNCDIPLTWKYVNVITYLDDNGNPQIVIDKN